MPSLKSRISKLEEAIPDKPWQENITLLPREQQEEYLVHGTINGEQVDDGLNLDEWTEEEMENYVKNGVWPAGIERRWR